MLVIKGYFGQSIKILALAIAVAFGGVTVAGDASAGPIVVFPDVNMFSSIPGGNATLLNNLLNGGTDVLISQKISGGTHQNTILDPFFDGISGVTSLASGAFLTGSFLTNIDLLFVDFGFLFTTNPYSSSEVDAISAFLANGGTLGVIGEVTDSLSAGLLNGFLADLGSSIMVDIFRCCGGLHDADTILTTSLTSGVTSFRLGAANPLTGGTAAIQDQGFTVVAFEEISVQIPEPGTLAIFGLGLLGMGMRRRRRRVLAQV